MSRPYLAAIRPSGTQHPAHANSAHTRRVSTQASKPGQGRRDHTVPPPQASTPTPKHANTPNANTPNANTQPPASKHAHTSPAATPTQTLSRPRHSAWAKQCKRGNPWQQGDRHEAKQAKPPQSGHADSAHKASAQTTWFAPKRCRPAPARRG